MHMYTHRLSMGVRWSLLALLLGAACQANTVTASADSSYRGWVTTSTYGTGNYQAGFSSFNAEYRNWFEFTLPNMSAGVPIAANLYINGLRANDTDPSETWEIHGVAAPFVFSYGYFAGDFNNIGWGTTYGSFVYLIPADKEQWLTIPLDAAALNDIITLGAGATFQIGGIVTTRDHPFAYETIFTELTDSTPQLRITLSDAGNVPEPASLALVSLGLAALLGIRRGWPKSA